MFAVCIITKHLCGVEVNFSTFPERELERLGYINLYQRVKEDDITHEIIEKKFGFKTTLVTRPAMIANLVEIMRENIEVFNSVEYLRECLSFIRNERGRAEAEAGMHDDRVLAMCIAHYIREQQSMTLQKEKKSELNTHYYTKTELEDFKPNAFKKKPQRLGRR